MPPLTNLRAFDAAARHGNIRLAAEELGVTHGAVAQQVRALEASLGVRLFERGPHGVTLTAAGRTFHPPIRHAFGLISGAVAAVQPRQGRGARLITVTVTPSFAARWLIPRLGRFAAGAPQVEVRVLASERQEPLGGKGAPDLGIRLIRPPFTPELDVTLLLPVRLFPVCSPAVAAELHGVHDLARATLLHDAQVLWPMWLERMGVPTSVAVSRRFSHSALALDAALQGQGVAMAPGPLVADDLARGRLVAPFGVGDYLDSDRAFYLVTPKGSRLRHDVAAFREWLMAESERLQAGTGPAS